MNIIFFDSECPFCYQAVQKILRADTRHLFHFAPLKGETAQNLFIGPYAFYRAVNSLILVEHPYSTTRRFWIYGQAVSRIGWLLGGGHSLYGVFSFLPSWLTDPMYKFVAAHRHQFKLRIPTMPIPAPKLLP
jgi:predicted DCC family thiol-disulfide oxidoreductase YuxK